MRLDTSSWGTFRIGDIFTITRGKTLTSEDKEKYSGNIPCVNGASENNGVLCKLNEQIGISGKANLIKAPALSLSRVGNSGLTMFQAKDFYVADNSFGMKFIEAHTELCYMFISAILNLERFKYSYGRTIALSKYYDTRIKLPTYIDGSPDWDYMESYMKTLHYKPLTTKNKKENIIPLHPAGWKKFRVGDLFVQERGAEAAPNQNEDGEVPIINETETNNGFVRNVVPTKVFAGNAITISINFARNVFYQPTDFCASVNIAIIRNKNLNAFNGLFIASVLRINNLKYSYGYKISKDKIDNTILKLPATPFGSPDWQFMESYIKSLPYSDRI